MNIEINESAWQFAVDKHNQAAEAAHEASQASKPEDEREDFEPVTLEEYVKARVADIENSYNSQAVQENLSLLSKESPESIARMAKVAQASPQVKEALAAQVDAL